MASSAGSLTVPKEPRSLSLSKGARYFVHNERRMWKTTINGISCLTSLKRKRRNNVWMVNEHLKNLRLRFRLVKICNKKLCSLAQERTVAHASDSERCVFLPWLLLLLILPSVSMLLSFPCFSVLIRGKFFCFCFVFLPWQMLILNSVAHATSSERYVAFVFPKPIFYKGLR